MILLMIYYLKVSDLISNNNIQEDKNTSKLKKDLDDEINNIFN